MAGLFSPFPYFPESPKRYIVEAESTSVNHTWIDFEADILTDAMNKLTELQNRHNSDVIYTIFDREAQRRIYVTDVVMQR